MQSNQFYLERLAVRLELAICEAELAESNLVLITLKKALAHLTQLAICQQAVCDELRHLALEIALAADAAVDAESLRNLAAGFQWLSRPVSVPLPVSPSICRSA